MNPGVVSRGELLDLCTEEAFTRRTVVLDIRFAGRSEFLAAKAVPNGDGWITLSPSVSGRMVYASSSDTGIYAVR